MNLAQKKFLLIFVLITIFCPVFWGEGISETKGDHMLIGFDNADERSDWRIVNDDVMGGISRSEIVFSGNGTAIFQGTVSLDNNGGFASTRTKPRSYGLDGYMGFLIRIRGDGNDYQLRLRTDDLFDGISYRSHFVTQPQSWTTIRIPFSDFVPVFRGRIQENTLPLTPEKVQQIGFLIADKQTGKFRLEIDWIKAYKRQ